MNLHHYSLAQHWLLLRWLQSVHMAFGGELYLALFDRIHNQINTFYGHHLGTTK